MRRCLTNLASSGGLKPPVTVDFNYACQGTRDHGNVDISMGHCSSGMCDVINAAQPNRKCSTFTILREPFERMTSHYYYLRQCANTTMIDNTHAQKSRSMKLADWALLTGSETRNKFFRKEELVQHTNGSRFCNVESEPLQNFENDIYMENILQNLDKHLGVIGLTSEYEMTLKMLQRAYSLPFYDLCKDFLLNKGTYGNRKDVSIMKQIKANAVRQLKQNQRVKQMLHLDIEIYEKAKEIFQKQKELMNDIR